MKKILSAFVFILLSVGVSAQLQQQSMGGSPTTLNTVQGGFWPKLYMVIPKLDTVNNPAKFYPGAITIRPQDTLLTDYPPIYMSNGRFWISVSSGAGQGIDSITVSADSTLYQAYNQGNQVFTFSTLMRHVRAGANVYFTRDVDTLVVNSVTGGTGNGLVSVGGLVLSDSTLYVQHDIVWRISNVLYTRITDTFYVIPSADTNYYRKDVIYIDSADGSFNYLQGTQDTVIAYPPVIPAGGIIVTIVDVFGPTITQPVPFVVNGYWATAGNLGTNPTTDGIGTLDSVDLKMITKGIERLRFKANGDIIIPEYITGHTGTAIGNLQLDATGKMILGDASGSQGLQSVLNTSNALTRNDSIISHAKDFTIYNISNGSQSFKVKDFQTVQLITKIDTVGNNGVSALTLSTSGIGLGYAGDDVAGNISVITSGQVSIQSANAIDRQSIYVRDTAILVSGSNALDDPSPTNIYLGWVDTVETADMAVVIGPKGNLQLASYGGGGGGGGGSYANFYLKDSTLSGRRTVNGGGFGLEFNNLSNIVTASDSVNISDILTTIDGLLTIQPKDGLAHILSLGGVMLVDADASIEYTSPIISFNGSKMPATIGTTGQVLTLTDNVGTSAWQSTGLSSYLPLAGGTMVGNILFTDNTYDIGSAAARARTGYFGTSLGIGITPTSALHVLGTSGNFANFQRNSSAAGATNFIGLFNDNTTDNNGAFVDFTTTTTGVGATSGTDMAKIGALFTTHDHPTRAAALMFATGNGGAPSEKMRLSAVGNLGIGVTNPLAYLHIKAGTTAANTAPIKLSSGSLNTTAEAGALEFLTDAYYGTITTGAARKTFAFLESPSFTTPSLGVATATSINGNILTTGSSTYTGTAGQTYTFPTTTATIARTDASQSFAGTNTFVTTIHTTELKTNATATNSNFLASSSNALPGSVSTARYLINGNNAQFRVGLGGSVATVATASTDVWALLVGNNTFTEATSGTSALAGGVGIVTQTFTGGSGATTDFQNLYVGDKPTGGTNNWSANLGETLIREKLNITTGSNKSVGVSAAMTAGTITISTTAVTASSKIFLVHATVGGTQGILSVGTITAGTSFVINSSNAADTGTVNWWIIN